ncbi:class I SAM-dependent methyltransferase [Nocardia farcinica]|uniref:class I SAM-dependent methyltransferase n=1 Tax=Nocardia farcinica TaxID=37329 RepID=UPI001B3C900D|nr:class I SAM-dependent methyltransferase [Nocardia farcinica]MBF6537448.1 class I SAM-dependent methyltransferase [Nocardia farcinica]
MNTFLDPAASTAYDRRATRLLTRFYDRVAVEVDAPPGARLLDVGTGPGRLLARIARRRPDLVLAGADLSPHMIELATRRAPGARLAVADVADLPFPDGSLDYVVSTLSMHEWPDLPAAAAELARVLAPGGRLVVYDFRFVRTAPALTALRSVFGTVERAPLSWFSLFTRITARPGDA